MPKLEDYYYVLQISGTICQYLALFLAVLSWLQVRPGQARQEAKVPCPNMAKYDKLLRQVTALERQPERVRRENARLRQLLPAVPVGDEVSSVIPVESPVAAGEGAPVHVDEIAGTDATPIAADAPVVRPGRAGTSGVRATARKGKGAIKPHWRP